MWYTSWLNASGETNEIIFTIRVIAPPPRRVGVESTAERYLLFYLGVINHLFRVLNIAFCWHKINNNVVNIALRGSTCRNWVSSCRETNYVKQSVWLLPSGIESHIVGCGEKIHPLHQGSRCFHQNEHTHTHTPPKTNADDAWNEYGTRDAKQKIFCKIFALPTIDLYDTNFAWRTYQPVDRTPNGNQSSGGGGGGSDGVDGTE